MSGEPEKNLKKRADDVIHYITTDKPSLNPYAQI